MSNDAKTETEIEGAPLTDLGMVLGALVKRLGEGVSVTQVEMDSIEGISITQIEPGVYQIEAL